MIVTYDAFNKHANNVTILSAIKCVKCKCISFRNARIKLNVSITQQARQNDK